MNLWLWIASACWEQIFWRNGVEAVNIPQNLVSLMPVKEIIENDHIGFILPSMKSSKAQDQSKLCINLDSPLSEPTSEFLFIIEVEDELPFHTDASRFGGTNTERGKQSLDISIYNDENGDLLRSKRNLQSGISVIEVNPHGAKKFRLCFINLSYDSSWHSIDTVKIVNIKMTTNDYKPQHQIASRLRKEVTMATMDKMDECCERLVELTARKPGNELLSLERERRDLNEDIFTWLLYGEVTFTIAVICSQLILTYHYIMNMKKGAKNTRQRRRRSPKTNITYNNCYL